MTDRVVSFGVNGSVVIRASALIKGLDSLDRITYRHMRAAMSVMFATHRTKWLTTTRVDFDPSSRGMRAEKESSRQGELTGGRGKRSVYFKVFPEKKRIPTGQRVPTLSEIRAETYTHSIVAEGLEFGGTFRPKSGRWLAIPIGVTLDARGRPKSRWVTPTAYRAASERNKLVSLKLGSGPPVVYQVKGGGSKKSAQTAGALTLLKDRPTGRRKNATRILLPAYQLVRQVKRRPLLRYYDTWDHISADRDRILKTAADRIKRSWILGESS